MTNDRSLRVTAADLNEEQRVTKRQELLQELAPGDYAQLFSYEFDAEQVGRKNCENLIGSIELPVGVAGPVVVKGMVGADMTGVDTAVGDLGSEEIYLPLATSEGALVASVSRGCKALSASGGVSLIIKKIGMTRAPVFRCRDGAHAQQFVEWLDQNQAEIARLTEATSHHLKYLSYQAWIRGRQVFVRFVFDTDQAMGMNMVTIALQTALSELLPKLDGVELVSLSSNVCTDKKDSVINSLYGRGYWVQAEAFIPHDVIKNILKADAEVIFKTHLSKNLIGSNLAGSHSQNMQAANVIAAIYAATGQDLAHVVEGSQATTSIELVDDAERSGIYAAVTLPNINVGAVGGGTGLPAQSQAKKIIRGGKELTAEQLAGAVAAGVLAVELSGLAALSTHTLAQAHQKLGRDKS